MASDLTWATGLVDGSSGEASRDTPGRGGTARPTPGQPAVGSASSDSSACSLLPPCLLPARTCFLSIETDTTPCGWPFRPAGQLRTGAVLSHKTSRHMKAGVYPENADPKRRSPWPTLQHQGSSHKPLRGSSGMPTKARSQARLATDPPK